MASAGTYYGDAYTGDWWPPRPRQPEFPVRGARGGVTSLKGDRRPGNTVRVK